MSDHCCIQFTQDQARALTGVSIETVRHWRKTVSYLSAKTGKVARFAFTDVVGLAVTHELVSGFGVHIATLSSGIDALFRLLAKIGPEALNSSIVLITRTDAIIYEDDGRGSATSLVAPALVVPLNPLILEIKRRMMPTVAESNQAILPFPPEVARRT